MDLLRGWRGPRGDQGAAAKGELPSQINHYRVRRLLGQGGMENHEGHEGSRPRRRM
jgi:hypothetical protein